MKRDDIKNPVLRFLWSVDQKAQQSIKWLCIIFMAAVLLVCVIQVILRYCFSISFRWSEELARLLTIYAALLGGTWGARRGELARVTILVDRLPPKMVMILEWVCEILIAFFAVVALCGAIRVMVMVAQYKQLTAGLQWPKWISYLSVALSMAFLLFFTVNKMIFRIAGIKEEESERSGGEGMV